MAVALTTRVMTADCAAVAAAARCLAAGGLVAFPTETVYGLGADATNGAAVARLYAAKGRPSFNPLIAHVADAQAARRLARFDDAAERLAALWPGPLTLVLAKAQDCPVSDLATAFGRPVVAPSANRSGHVSPTTAAHVRADLDGAIDLIVDGGPAPMGLESTIVACLGERPVLLRPGAIPRGRIEQVLGGPLLEPPVSLGATTDDEAPLAPGQLASHYAPKARLRLNVDAVRPGEALLAFGPDLPPGAEHAARVLNLSRQGDLVEAAANLFSHLRALDAAGAAAIAVMPVPASGLGEAINDRLARAAAPR
jgi:L-threonylcarbamoyladenylate synthase